MPNPGEQIKIPFHNAENKPQKFIEDIPDFQKKLKAFEYVHLPNRSEIHRDYVERFKNNTTDAHVAAMIINRELEFPRVEVLKARKYGGGDTLIFPNIEDIKKYYEDILDKDGNLLPSRDHDVQKAA